MDGNPQIIAKLNELLTHELTAIDLYFLQSQMCADWGYTKLAAHFQHEKEEEQAHCTEIIDRILFLGGTPEVGPRHGFAAETDIVKLIRLGMDFEIEVARMLNEMIGLCREAGDSVTRAMLERLLIDTETDHIYWQEAQLKMIADMGVENYLAQQR